MPLKSSSLLPAEERKNGYLAGGFFGDQMNALSKGLVDVWKFNQSNSESRIGARFARSRPARWLKETRFRPNSSGTRTES
jgi:hypothetical protein